MQRIEEEPGAFAILRSASSNCVPHSAASKTIATEKCHSSRSHLTKRFDAVSETLFFFKFQAGL
ncbi:MAG TPA: hypothetical protein DD423_05835 [Opitutae bacterium]|nr:hypothetical protein [Opitutae bacterium]